MIRKLARQPSGAWSTDEPAFQQRGEDSRRARNRRAARRALPGGYLEARALKSTAHCFSLLLVLLAVLPLALHATDCAAQLKSLGVKQLFYAAPGGSTADSCGTSSDTACASIQHAIDRCSAAGAGCTVVVQYGLFSGQPPIQLAAGVNVLGGCSLNGSPTLYRTVVRGLPAFTAANITRPTLLSSFVIVGADATEPSAASIAMTVTDSSALRITDSQLVSGKGGNGRQAAGIHADSGGNGQSAPDDQHGGQGGQACASNGAGKGGQGADYDQIYSSGCFTGVCSCTNNNYPNSVGRQGGSSGSVAGGYGGAPGTNGAGCGIGDGPGRNIPSCDPGRGDQGKDGGAGSSGNQGGQAGSNILGSFHGTTWVPAQAGSGNSGNPGSGGGGGGSGGMSVAAGLSSHDYPGEPGGGGGAGGCGGVAGNGGLQGGASIPLVLLRSSVPDLAASNVFIPGPGGRGADGQPGAQGGQGGQGTNGRLGGGNTASGTGCDNPGGNAPGGGGRGGNGGPGGGGSGGAGGNGGPSIGVAVVDSGFDFGGGLRIYHARPGTAGNGGSGGNNGAGQTPGSQGKQGTAGYGNDNASVGSYQSQ